MNRKVIRCSHTRTAALSGSAMLAVLVPSAVTAEAAAEEEEIVVTGSIIEAQIASIEAKREAINLVDVAAADLVGRFPDQNSEAALSCLPAVEVQRDQGPERNSRISACETGPVDQQLVALLLDADEAPSLILAAPGFSINQVAKAGGRCRKQLTKLFALSRLSPRIVEAVMAGTQPKRLTRTQLLHAELPFDWLEQEALFGFAAWGSPPPLKHCVGDEICDREWGRMWLSNCAPRQLSRPRRQIRSRQTPKNCAVPQAQCACRPIWVTSKD